MPSNKKKIIIIINNQSTQIRGEWGKMKQQGRTKQLFSAQSAYATSALQLAIVYT